MNNILDRFYKDYKDIFIDNLEKKSVVNEETEPEIKLPLDSLEEMQLKNNEEENTNEDLTKQPRTKKVKVVVKKEKPAINAS